MPIVRTDTLYCLYSDQYILVFLLLNFKIYQNLFRNVHTGYTISDCTARSVSTAKSRCMQNVRYPRASPDISTLISVALQSSAVVKADFVNAHEHISEVQLVQADLNSQEHFYVRVQIITYHLYSVFVFIVLRTY